MCWLHDPEVCGTCPVRIFFQIRQCKTDNFKKERQRETDRQTERQRETDRETERQRERHRERER